MLLEGSLIDMDKYYCNYNNGLLNCVHDYVVADSKEEAKEMFIAEWGVAKPHLVNVELA